MEELEKAQQRVRTFHQDYRELKDTVEHLRDEVRVRDENIDRLQDQNIREYEEQIAQLRHEIDRMHVEFAEQGELNATVGKLQAELDALRYLTILIPPF